MNKSVYLNDLGIVNSQAIGKAAVLKAVLSGNREQFIYQPAGESEYPVGVCKGLYTEEAVAEQGNRINVLLHYACNEITDSVVEMKKRFGAERIGVILGSTDNGSEESFKALRNYRNEGSFPEGYTLEMQQAHYPVEYVKTFFGLKGFGTSISTACTSSGSALALARRLILSGMIDGAVVGGADIVSESVLKGFVALEAVDNKPTIPFSRNRNGINLGEGAALFTMTAESMGESSIRLIGCGESSDAHHMTAPDPEGKGAASAMKEALKDADLSTVDYINLHGTGTELNDIMESKATASVFETLPFSSSTKPMTGHTLGAASSMELGFCWLVLSPLNEQNFLPPHLWDGEKESESPSMNMTAMGTAMPGIKTCMSNSYAFGGCNVSLIISNEDGQ
jgi:3-oxoacyl-[acyl-carrier-protein] synthase-1